MTRREIWNSAPRAMRDDLLYDDIGSGLKIKELRQKNEDLLRGLELYYKVIFDKLEE